MTGNGSINLCAIDETVSDRQPVKLSEQVERLEANARFASDQVAAYAKENETLRSRNDNQKELIERLRRQREGLLADPPEAEALLKRISNQSAELTLLLRSKEYLKEQLINKSRVLEEVAQDLREAKTDRAELQRRANNIREYILRAAAPEVRVIKDLLYGN